MVFADPEKNRTSETPTMPIIAYELVGYNYNETRKLQNTGKTAYKKTANTFNYQYNPAPYDLKYKVHVMVKNMEDGLKIIEQILPYFTPEMTFKLKLIPQMEEERNISVNFEGVSFEDNSYSSDIKKRKYIAWELGFTVKGYLWGPIKSAPVINFTNTSFFAYTTEVGNTYNVAPAFNTTVVPGLTSNGQPTSNAAQSKPKDQIEVTDDYGFIETKEIVN